MENIDYHKIQITENMKPIINSHIEIKQQESYQENTQIKKLMQLINTNREKQFYIEKLEKQILELQNIDIKLSKDIVAKDKQLQQLKQVIEEQAKRGEEDQAEMQQWIESVQKYTGIPQHAIDSLLTLEYEPNGQSEICLSCYQELKPAVQCKYLPCSHIFHVECINAHLKVNKLCPGCGEEVLQ